MKKNIQNAKKNTLKFCFILVSILFIGLNTTYSQNIWNGLTNSNWNTASNWSLGSVPGINEFVEIQTSTTPGFFFPRLTSNVTITSLRISNAPTPFTEKDVILNVNDFKLTIGRVLSASVATGIFKLENVGSGTGLNFVLSCSGACNNGQFSVHGTVDGVTLSDKMSSDVSVDFNIYNTTISPSFKLTKFTKNLTISGMASTDPCIVFKGFNYDDTGYTFGPPGDFNYWNWNITGGLCTLSGHLFLVNRTNKVLRLGWRGFKIGGNLYVSNTGGGVIRTAEVTRQTLISLETGTVALVPSETLPQNGLIQLLNINQKVANFNLDLTTCPSGCSVSPTGNAGLSMSANTFAGTFFLKTPSLNMLPLRDPDADYVFSNTLDNNTFLNTFSLIKTGTQNDVLAGGNVFKGAVNITNLGTGSLNFSTPTSQSVACGFVGICGSCQSSVIGDYTDYDVSMPGDNFQTNITVEHGCSAGPVNLVSSSNSFTTITGDLMLKLRQNTTITGGLKFKGTGATQNFAVNDACNTNPILSVGTVQPALPTGNLRMDYTSGLASFQKLFIFDKATIFTSGKIDANNNIIQMNGLGTAHTGTNSSYIIVNTISGVRRNIPNSASPMTYPVGTANDYLPINIENASTNNAPVLIQLRSGVLRDYANFTSSGTNVGSKFINSVWFANSTVVGLTAQLQGGWSSNATLTGFAPGTSARMARNNGTVWECVASSGVASGGNPAFVPNYSTQSSSALPGIYSVLSDRVLAGVAQTICGVTNTTAIMAATAFTSGTWTVQSQPSGAAAAFSSNTAINATVSGLTVDGNYTLRWTSTGDCGNNSDFSDVVITKRGSTNIPRISYAIAPFCNVGTSSVATITPNSLSGGTFSAVGGLSINASTGVINLGSSPATNHIVNYTVSILGCGMSSTTLGITINSVPGVTLSYAGSPYCNNGLATPTTNTGGGFFSTSAGGLSLSTNNGTIDLASSSAGTYVVKYNLSVLGCALSTVSSTITVTTLPNTPILNYGSNAFCSSNTITITSIVNTFVGGTFASTAAGFSFNGSGTITIPQNTVAGLFVIRYDIPAGGGCPLVSGNTIITLSGVPKALSISGVTGTQCYNSSHILTANGTVSGTSITWKENGIIRGSNAATLTTSSLTSNINTYFAIINNGVCAAVTSSGYTINVHPNPTITGFNVNKTFACTSQDVTLGNTAIVGTLSYAVNTGAGFNIFSGNTYTFNNTILGNAFSFVGYAFVGGCQTVTSPILIVNSSTCGLTADFTTNPNPVCLTSGVVTITNTSFSNGGTITGYLWNFAGGSGGNINTAGPHVITFTGAGTKNITLSIVGTGGVTNTTSQIVVINSLTGSTISYTTPSCNIASSLSPSVFNPVSGGIFSTSGVNLSLDVNTGVVNPAVSTQGTYTIQYNYTIPGCGALSTTTTLRINSVPGITFNYSASPFCKDTGGNTLAPNATIGGVGGIFSGPSGLVFANNTTGSVNLAASSTGTYNVTYTISIPGCGNVASTVGSALTINSIPGVNIIYPTPTCNTQSTMVASTVLNTVSGGTYSSQNGLSIANNGTITPTTSLQGNYRILYTYTIAGCGQQIYTTAGIAITSLPSTPILDYGSNAFCSSTSPTISSIQNTFTGGDFNTTALGFTVNNFGTITIPRNTLAGVFAITYDIPAQNGCAAVTGSTTITLSGVPKALSISGVTGTQCFNSSHILTANGTVSGTSITWKENGINSGNAARYTTTGLNTGTNTFYAIINNNVCTPVTSTGFDIEVYLNPTISGISSNKPFACRSQSISLTEDANQLGTLLFAVNTGAGFSMLSGNTYEFLNTIVGNAFSFVGYSFVAGCQTLTSPVIIVNSSVCGLTADFDRNTTQQCLINATASGVTFTNRSTTAGGTITGYYWDFGSDANPATTIIGINSTPYNINVKYANSGLKTITLTVIGTGGVTNITSNDVLIDAVSQKGLISTSIALPICYNTANDLQLSNSLGDIQWYNTLIGIMNTETSTLLGTGALLNDNTYYATLKNGVCPMVTTDGFAVNVRTQATVTGYNLPTEFQCLGADAPITATGINGTVTGWQTSDNNINWTNIAFSGSILMNVQNLDDSQYYRAIVTNGVGCTPVEVTNTVLVTATGCSANVSFTGLPTNTCSDFAANTGFVLENKSTSQAPFLGYAWNFGAGASPQTFAGISNMPTVRYTTSGIKTVFLTVTIAGGKVFTNASTMVGASLLVDQKPTATFTYPNGSNYCQNFGVVSTATFVATGTSTTGNFFSNNSGISINTKGEINTNASTANTTGTIFYALDATAGCPPSTSTGVSFTIRQNPSTTTPVYTKDVYCALGNTQASSSGADVNVGYYSLNDGSVRLATTSGGSFNIANITTSLKQYQVTYIIKETATCKEETSTPKTLTINGENLSPYIINYILGNEQCASSNVPTSGIPTGALPTSSIGRFSSNIANAVDINTGNITYSAFPVGTTNLNVQYSYTYPGENCVAINSTPYAIAITKLSKPLSDIVPLSYNTASTPKGLTGNLCNNPNTIIAVSPNFTYTGGVFTITGGANINTLTGELNLSNMLGEYRITHTISAAGKCEAPPMSETIITVTTANFENIVANQVFDRAICAYYNDKNITSGNVFYLTGYTEGSVNWQVTTPKGLITYTENEPIVTKRTFVEGGQITIKATVSNKDCISAERTLNLRVDDEPKGGKTIPMTPRDTLMCYNTLSTNITLDEYRGDGFKWEYIYIKANFTEDIAGVSGTYTFESQAFIQPPAQPAPTIIHNTRPFELDADFQSTLYYRAKVTNGECIRDKNLQDVFSSYLKLRKCKKYPFIPNALEPNGANSNNTIWNIQQLRLPDDAEIKIMNRYGVEVVRLTGKDIQNKPFDGDGLPAGTYYYSIDTKDGKPFVGDLTIMR